MGWFANLKTGHKLAIGFSLNGALLLVLGVLALGRMSDLAGVTNKIVTDHSRWHKYFGTWMDGGQGEFAFFNYRTKTSSAV